MSQNLFSFSHDGCIPLAAWQPFDERQVQHFFERNPYQLLKLGAVASEWCPEGESLRMDTLAINEHGHPVIIEFKKVSEASALSQVLAYKTCLMRHQREFEALVRSRWANALIDWSAVHLVCIAPTFNRYDLDALDSVKADIDLIAYQFFGQDNVLVNTVKSTRVEKKQASVARSRRTFCQQQDQASDEVRDLITGLRAALAEHDDIYQTQTREGVTLSASGIELGQITLTQGLHPRIKITMPSEPSQEISAGLGSIRKGKGMTEITLRKTGEIPYLVSWVEQECRSALVAF